MTVETTTRKTIQNMTASIIEYTFTFRALLSSPADIKCIRTVTATSVDTDMERVTEIPAPSDATDVLKYMVDINDDGVGGTVTVMWPSTSCTITIYRDTTDLQSSDYEDYNQFPADTVENDLDRRTMRSQDQKEILTRTLQYPITAPSGSSLPTPAADLFLGWDAAGVLLENKSLPDPSVLVLASEADAVAGTNNTDYMSPFRTKQAVRTLGTVTITTFASIAMMDAVAATVATMIVTTSATIAALTATTINVSSGTIAGAVTGATQSASDNSTKLATTEYADAAGSVAGSIVQVVNTMSSVILSGSTVMPDDNTIPQITEGDQYMSLAITPNAAANKLKIDVTVCGASSNGTSVYGLFKVGTSDTLAVAKMESTANYLVTTTFSYYFAAGTTSEITFTVRAGGTAGTFTFNGSGVAAKYGSKWASSITITEIKT